MVRRPLVAGNWKMNGLRADLSEIRAIREAVDALGGDRPGIDDVEILVCPPATLLRAASEIAAGSALAVGAQACHPSDKGPHTGDLSPVMIADAGATYVIVGHSERRADHGETNVAVRRQAAGSIAAGLTAIVCVGETKENRDADRALSVVGRQIVGSVPAAVDPGKIVLAYEPIWAIGTGVTPIAEDIEEMHDFMRREIVKLFGAAGADVRLLYGGSVKPDNAAALLRVANVDGALVGGASLSARDFMAIAATYRAPAPAG